MSRPCALAGALLLAGTLAGCGSPPGDLFVVQRSGTIPGSHLRLLVADDGTVSCNGGASREITSAQLLAARSLARGLAAAAQRRVDLPPGPNAVFRYRVRVEQGTIAFSDTSRRLTPALTRVEALTHELATGPCGLRR